MTFEELKALDDAYIMHTYARFPVDIDHGEGATLYSLSGRKYIDFTSGIGVNALGYGNEKWMAAITAQIGKLGHISNLFYTQPGPLLAKELCTRSGMDKVFFGNSGAEANEAMIKVARKYSFDKYGKGRSTVITLHHSFHGRTITTLTATGQDSYHNYFFPFNEAFRYAEPTLESVLAQAGEDVCGVMVELIQGEGGVRPLDPKEVQAIADLCREKDWLLLVDEVQTGIGRTGSLFAFQQFGIQPDVVSFAKGIAGGLPLGGHPHRREVFCRPHPGHPRLHLRGKPCLHRRGAGGAGDPRPGLPGRGAGEGRLPPGGDRGHRLPLPGPGGGHGPDAGHRRPGGPYQQGAGRSADGPRPAVPHRRGPAAAAAPSGDHQGRAGPGPGHSETDPGGLSENKERQNP